MQGEKVLGGFEVETRLALGSEHLFLLFTGERLIFAHLAKVGWGSMALSGVLGGLSRGVGRSPRKGTIMEKIAALGPDEILRLDKGNFAVDYSQVVSVTVGPGGYDRGKIILVTTDMKVEMFASLTAIQGLRQTMEDELESKVLFRL